MVWQASAPEMNPILPVDYLRRMEAEDPEAYRSEVLGEFRAGVSSLFDPDALDAVVDRGRRETAPQPGVRYMAHYDASGGRSDAAALAIGHRDGQLIRVDLVRRWPAPHNPESVIAEAAEILRSYGAPKVQIDRYAGEFPSQAFSRHGVRAEVAAGTTSDHHMGMLPIVNAATVRLPDVPELLRELRGLERRVSRGAGRDTANHRSGSHDDTAAAVSGVCALLAAKSPRGCGVNVGQDPELEARVLAEMLARSRESWARHHGQEAAAAPPVAEEQVESFDIPEHDEEEVNVSE
jgi:hypothetical protein